MKKSFASVLAAALVLGALFVPVAEAGKRKSRKATGTYSAPSAAVEGNGYCDPGCVRFNTKSSERYVQMTVVDQTGLPVSAQVTVPDQNGDGFVDTIAAFCGKSGKIPFTGGLELSVFLYGHPTTGLFEQFGGPTACNGAATGGKVKAVFTR
jgi:hypothetical protein